MNDSRSSHRPDTIQHCQLPAWPIKLIGGTAVGKFGWYLRLAGLIFLGLIVSIVIGVIVGLLSKNGDAGILTITFCFILGVVAALLYVKSRVARPATVLLAAEALKIRVGNDTIADWKLVDIRSVSSAPLVNHIGLQAALPSSFSKIIIEHGPYDSIVFEMHDAAASNFVATMSTLTRNAVYTGLMTATHVPNASERPIQVWQTKLRSEFRKALSEIGFGLFGSGYLCLFVNMILTGRRPEGRLGLILLMMLVSLFGPFLLFSGTKGLFTYFSRRRRFTKLSKQSKNEAINQLLTELYGKSDSSEEHSR